MLSIIPQKMRVIRLVLDPNGGFGLLQQRLAQFVRALRILKQRGYMENEQHALFTKVNSTANLVDLEALEIEAEEVMEEENDNQPHKEVDESDSCSITQDVSEKDLANGLALVIEGSALEAILARDDLCLLFLLISTVCEVGLDNNNAHICTHTHTQTHPYA